MLAQEDLPAVGLREARDASEQCGLAGAAGAEYRDDLARRHLEGYIVEHDTVAEPLAQPDDADPSIASDHSLAIVPAEWRPMPSTPANGPSPTAATNSNAKMKESIPRRVLRNQRIGV